MQRQTDLVHRVGAASAVVLEGLSVIRVGLDLECSRVVDELGVGRQQTDPLRLELGADRDVGLDLPRVVLQLPVSA